MSRTNHIGNQAADQKLCDGIKNNPQSFPLVIVGGKPVAAADAVAMLQARIDATARIAPAKTAWLGAVKAARDERARSLAVITAVRQAILAAFADSVDTLGRYGLKPRKQRVTSPQTQVVAAAKARATRTARHTMGSRQKQAVKGDVKDVVITPVTSSAPPQPAPAGATASPQSVAPAGAAATTAAPAKLG
jgi:hypothetical protein